MPETTQSPILRTERLETGRIARFVIDNGRGNVIDSHVISELRRALAELEGERELAALILDHAGPDFSFGASVEEHAPGKVEAMLPQFHALARELAQLCVPWIACVRGKCLGGGLEIVALADLVIASPSARFGQPEVKLGVFAPVGSLVLPRLVGARHAADLLLSGRSIDAIEARALGLVSDIAADPTEAARAWACEHLSWKSSAALRFAVRALRSSWVPQFVDDLERLESLYLEELLQTEDALEGIRAFLEKRTPQWKHR